MMAFPDAYKWLLNEPYPRHLRIAVSTHGVVETPGAGNNATIIGWAQELGGWVEDFYSGDAIPWCGLWMAMVMHRAGRGPLPKNPLSALSWAEYGVRGPANPELGDVLSFTRRGGGHVGLYVGEDDECLHVLGGNQSDAVSFSRIHRSRLYASRRPRYQSLPSTIRRVRLSADGKISRNEA